MSSVDDRLARASGLFDLLSHLLPDEWGGHPACVDAGDPELWHPVSERDTYRIAHAKTICRGCPIQGSCLQYAMRHDEHGIWGGTTETDRRTIRAARTEGMAA